MASAFRNFILSFILASVIFTLIAIGGVKALDVYILNPDTSKPDDTETGDTVSPITTDEDNNKSTIKSGRTFSFLLIGSDYQPDVYDDYENNSEEPLFVTRKRSADTIIYFMFNKEKNEFVATPFPSNTIVQVDGVRMPLSKAYAYKDEKYMCDIVSSLVGISIDYYASCTIDSLIQIIDYYGGFDFNVPINVDYVNEYEGIDISLNKGFQHLDGKQSLAYLRYDGYIAGQDRMQRGFDFLLNMIDVFSSDVLNKYKYQNLFLFMSDKMVSNMTLEFLKENIDFIFRYQNMTKTILTYPGQWTSKGFEPNYSNGIEQYKDYRY